MFIKLGKIKYLLLALLLSMSVPLTIFGEGHDDGNNNNNNNQQGNGNGNGNPTPTPPPGGTPTPAPTPNPMNSGPAANATSPDNRYVTVELQTEHPAYSARGYQAIDLTANSLIHYSARFATFRGFYTGSNRGSGSNPPSTAPITDSSQLTQAASPPPPTPTPSPGQKVRKQKTAKQFADDGNDNNQQQGQHGGGN